MSDSENALMVQLTGGLAKIRQLVDSVSLADMGDRHKAVQVTDLGLRARKAKELAKTRMRQELAPLEALTDAIKARWDPLIHDFADLESRLKALTMEHVRLDRERVAKAQAAAAEELAKLSRAREEAEKQSKEAATPVARARAQLALVGVVTKQGQLLDAMEVDSKPVRGVKVEGIGTISVTDRWVWEVEDEAKVPREYLSPDKARISAAVKGGLRQIAGIRIFPTPKVSSRSLSRPPAPGRAGLATGSGEGPEGQGEGGVPEAS